MRLPHRAHSRTGGTKAVTDLLILRRREPGAAPAGPSFEEARRREVKVGVGDTARIVVNEYFVNNPKMMLGKFARTGRDVGIAVIGDIDAAPGLRAALKLIVAQARKSGLVMSARPDGPALAGPVVVAARSRRPDGYLEAGPDGTFTRVVNGVPVPHEPEPDQAAELGALIRLRDIEVDLLEAEANSIDDTTEIDMLRANLNRVYDDYVGTYGRINRFVEHRVDANAGQRSPVAVSSSQGGFRDDPYAEAVKALEDLGPGYRLRR